MKHNYLILFDIDSTMLQSSGMGSAAMLDAGKELFGEAFTLEGIQFAGGQDPLIFDQISEINSIRDAHMHHDKFRDAYRDRLQQVVDNEERLATPLPGIETLVEHLKTLEHVTIGIVTGNYQVTGKIKLRAGGFNPDDFPVQAYGDDADSRAGMVAYAIKQYEEQTGETIPRQRVFMIGDTPTDIQAAHANSIISIGVATGHHDQATLHEHEPDYVFADLSSLEDFLDLLD